MKSFDTINPRMTRDLADTLNEMAETVEGLSRVGVGSISGEGLPEENPPPVHPTARITGIIEPAGGLDVLYRYTGNFVSFQSTPDSSGNYLPIYFDTLDNSGALRVVDFVMVERSNNADVPIDGSVVVDLLPGPMGMYIFDFSGVGVPLQAYARFVTQSLPAYTNTAGVLTASGNGALTSAYCDGVAPVLGDIGLFCLEGTADEDYGVKELTALGTASTPWVFTPVSPWTIQAAAQVFVGPEGTNDKNTVWQVATAEPITPGTTDVKFTRIYQEDRWVKVLASAGSGWDTTSAQTKTMAAGAITFSDVGAGLKVASGDTFLLTGSGGGGATAIASFTSYNSGTTTLVLNITSVLTGNGNACTSWVIATSQVQGYYAGTVYFQDKTSDVACWVKDASSVIPNFGVFYRASRNFNKTLDGVARGFYETCLFGPYVKSVVASCVAGSPVDTVVTGVAP